MYLYVGIKTKKKHKEKKYCVEVLRLWLKLTYLHYCLFFLSGSSVDSMINSELLTLTSIHLIFIPFLTHRYAAYRRWLQDS